MSCKLARLVVHPCHVVQRCWLWCLLWFLPNLPLFGAPVVINEIMFHPAPAVPEDNGLEWIELYNESTNAVNLNGWHFDKGISFTFTNFTLAPNSYVVVAANVGAFIARYPGVANVVGNWTGVLANNGEEIELVNADGNEEDSVDYASEGDWAVRVRGPFDLGAYGWDWFCAADGFGRSLELRNSGLSNNQGQNWAVSAADGGTPGSANNAATANIEPMILGVAHFPVVPRSSDPVTITASIVDESTNVTVTLWYRVDADPQNAFVSATMFDDGMHGDGLAGDGLYGVQFGTRPNLTIIEYYVEASDGTGMSRTWPPAAQQLGGGFDQTCNALYQVVDDFGLVSSNPLYHIIMTEIERAELDSIGGPGGISSDSDAAMTGTFISIEGSSTEVRHVASFRNRGHGSRGIRPNNIRVNIPNDRRWNGVRSLNLNSDHSYAQVFGSAIFQKAGLPMANSRPVQVRINGNLAGGGAPQYNHYAHNEELSGEFVSQHFPTDDGGNSYRGIRNDNNVVFANFTYLGPSKESCASVNGFFQCYTELYFKQNNNSEDNWSDLIELCRVLSDGTLTGSQYVNEVQRVLNVENAMLYFAVNTLVDNSETALSNGYGDDYATYRGVNDPRFVLVGYDVDTIMSQGGSTTASIFRMINGPGPGPFTRFMNDPQFIPIYYATLKRLIETTFSTNQINPMLDRVLGGWVPAGTITAMKNWQATRNNFILSQIPMNLTATTSLSLSNGYFHTTSPTVNLNGQGNAIDTRSIRVNGRAATWNAFGATWSISGVALSPGVNRILVQAFGTNSNEIARVSIDVWYNTGSVTTAPAEISSDLMWTPTGGPYLISGNVEVNAGATLTIRPGTTLFFAPGATLSIYGRLLAEGNETNRIRFTRQGGTGTCGIL